MGVGDGHLATRHGEGLGRSRHQLAGVAPGVGRVRRIGADQLRQIVPVLAQDLARPVRVVPADHIDRLVLEQLVGAEEVLDLDQPMGPDLGQLLDVRLVRVADRDAQDLVVDTLVIAHLEGADGACPDVAAGERRLVDEQQGVGRVAVAGEGVGHEAVVEVVEHRRRQHPIEAEDARRGVELVLVAAAAGISTTTSMMPGYGPGGVAGLVTPSTIAS